MPSTRGAAKASSQSGHNNKSASASSAEPSSSPLLHLPTELLRAILLLAPHYYPDNKSPAYALYQTCRAARASMWPWIGKTVITLKQAGAHARDAQEQLRRFPCMATLRKLDLILQPAVGEDVIVNFLSTKEANKLASVLHLCLRSEISLSLSSVMHIASACPSLRTLEFASGRSFTLIRGLRRLICLQDLHVKSAPSVLDPEDVEALGSLVRLQSLELAVNNLEAVLPRLSALTSLTELALDSDRAALSADVPEFSSLAALPALCKLTWAHKASALRNMSSSTLSAICSLTGLVSLDISRHRVVGASNVKLLVEMPRLEDLAVGSLQPEVLVSVSRCRLQYLTLTAWDEDCRFLARLPAEFLVLQKLQLPLDEDGTGSWIIRADGSAEAVARDVRAAAQLLSASGWQSDTVDAGYSCPYLDITWKNGPPAFSAACVIDSLSCLNLSYLRLRCWAVDKALALQLAEAAPGLDCLLLYSCSISCCGWVGLEALTQLSDLRVDAPLKRDSLAVFAAVWSGGQDLNVYISEDEMSEEVVEECNQGTQEHRRARGMASTVTLRPWY